MKITQVVTKTLKYLSYFLLILVLFAFFFVTFVLHTDAGSRFAINQAIKLAEIDVTYDALVGNVSDGLTITNFNYKDQAIDLKVDKISYQTSLSWFDRHIELRNSSINGVHLVIKENAATNSEDQPFSGIELPLTVDIKQLLINNFNITTAEVTNTIDLIELSALLQPSSTKLRSLKVTSIDYDFLTDGQVNYSDGLDYDLNSEWHFKQENNSFAGKGPIKGNLQAIDLQQILTVNTDVLVGEFSLDGTVNNLSSAAELQIEISADEANVLFNQQQLKLQKLTADANGLITDYQISLQATLSQDTVLGGKLPVSQVKLDAKGDTQHLIINNAQITSVQSSINLMAQLNWQDQFNLSSQLIIDRFNPEQLLPEWPGKINGKLDFNLAQTEQGMVLSVENQSLKGQLKGQDFTLTGSAIYSAVAGAETLTANQLNLSLGDNRLQVNGQIVEQEVALEVMINWMDLSVLDKQLSGTVNGLVNLTGDYQKPQLQVDLSGEKLAFAEHEINKLRINSSGGWDEGLESEIDIENAKLGGQQFNNILIQQNGWLNEHEIKVLLDADDFSSTLTVTGQLTANQANQQTWNGQINKHELIVNKDQRIRLQAPINVVVGTNQISLSQGCWQGVEAGTLCVALNDIKQTNNYQGSLTLDAFSLIPLQMFLPQGIEIKGKIQGDAEFIYQDSNINVSSNLQLIQGELLLKNETDVVYQTVINNFDITAITNQQNIVVSLNTTLADNSFLKLEAMVDKTSNQDWQINSSLNGAFYSSQLLTELTPEISQLEGHITIEGSVEGLLNQPNINLILSQPDGHVSLTRLGTVIEQLKLSVTTQGITQPTYQIQFSGSNIASVNQGSIQSTGELSLNVAEQWQYRGDITGENFMLLNLPEAKFNVSPKLTITANPQTTDIKGDLGIDYGHVIVKQLPASSIGNSDDLEIHSDESTKTVAYPITMNIRANINQPIALDVIGLVAELTGSIQLVQTKEQNLIGKGVLNLNKGSYEIYGQKLEINEGELTFTGPLDNPRLKVKASRKSISGDVVAGVDLGGTVNNLQSNLYSEPNLSDIEKLSYIMTGRGIDNSGSMNGEQLKQAAIVMGLNQSSPIFNQIQNQFGIDVLTLKESAVAADTVVEAGKKINDRLYVSYNQGLFNRLGFWVLKYRINQFLNLQTTQGEDQSVELVYTRKAEIKKKKQDD